jgi:hypothetical protein
MESGRVPITEDAVLYLLSRLASNRGSKVFIKIANNFSLDRDFFFWCAPDVDLLEVCADSTVIAYEAKGQRRRQEDIEPVGVLEGLGQALTYLDLPAINIRGVRTFDGGAPDFVYLVHGSSSPELLDARKKRIVELTPIGFLAAFPSGDRIDSQAAPTASAIAPQHHCLTEIVPPKPNPLQDPHAKAFLLEHLSSLEMFGEKGRSYRRIEAAGRAVFGI